LKFIVIDSDTVDFVSSMRILIPWKMCTEDTRGYDKITITDRIRPISMRSSILQFN